MLHHTTTRATALIHATVLHDSHDERLARPIPTAANEDHSTEAQGRKTRYTLP